MENFALSDDWRLVWKKGGIKRKVGLMAGSVGRDGYMRVGFMGSDYLAHRVIWALHHGEHPPLDMVVDHIDRNPLNNCPKNLRLCKQRENLLNRRGNKIATSDFKGVHWDSSRKKWCASGVDALGKYRALGRFASKLDAANMYNEFAKKEHGEFAAINDLSQPVEGQKYGRYVGIAPKAQA